jgi:crotonobetainyl-CoA:carnitine CoA-transferase CaiB-like acyl-CoA transferase
MGVERWCAIAVGTDEEWRAFGKALGEPDWAKDTKFATLMQRKQNEDELDHLVEEWTKDYSAEEVMFIMQAAGVPAGVVQNCQDLFEDPQVRHREHFRYLDHKAIGRHAYNAPAYRLSKTPAHIWKAGQVLGEDNEYVYKEVLGFSDEDIATLLVDGVITTEADLPKITAVRY